MSNLTKVCGEIDVLSDIETLKLDIEQMKIQYDTDMELKEAVITELTLKNDKLAIIADNRLKFIDWCISKYPKIIHEYLGD